MPRSARGRRKPVRAIAFQAASSPDAARWKQQAARVTIVRDDWGIAHVYGKTDADAVFGMMYTQAEDDFNRVETNYVNAMGRLAEAEGESKIYQDLRMKLFIDPGVLKTQYAASPAWLKTLMDANDQVTDFVSEIRRRDGSAWRTVQAKHRHVCRPGLLDPSARVGPRRHQRPRSRVESRQPLRLGDGNPPSVSSRPRSKSVVGAG